MALLERIDENKSMAFAPSIFNKNYTIIEEFIELVKGKLSIDKSNLKLVDADPGSNGISAKNIVLSSTNGTVLSVIPANGGDVSFYLTFDGGIVGKTLKFSSDDESDQSEIDRLLISNILGVKNIDLAGTLLLKGTSSKIVERISKLSIIPANVGVNATSIIDLGALGKSIFIDGSNGGSALNGTGTALINVNKTTLKLGEIKEIYFAKDNGVDKMGIYNGISGDETFAVMTANGISTLSHTNYPKQTSNNGKIKVMLYEVSTAVYRLLILEMTGMSY